MELQPHWQYSVFDYYHFLSIIMHLFCILNSDYALELRYEG